MKLRSHRETDEVPCARRERASVQEQERWQSRDSPVQVVKPHPSDNEIVVSGHHDFGNVDSGERDRVTEVVELECLVRRHRHAPPTYSDR
jgi:hypothetical protein